MSNISLNSSPLNREINAVFVYRYSKVILMWLNSTVVTSSTKTVLMSGLETSPTRDAPHVDVPSQKQQLTNIIVPLEATKSFQSDKISYDRMDGYDIN